MNSPTLQRIEDMRNVSLIELYEQCTPSQQLIFRRMYSHKNLDMPIDQIVENMPKEKKDWAIQQCENTVNKNNLCN